MSADKNITGGTEKSNVVATNPSNAVISNVVNVTANTNANTNVNTNANVNSGDLLEMPSIRGGPVDPLAKFKTLL